jgi:hypothetical protein
MTLAPLGAHQEESFQFSRPRGKHRSLLGWAGHFCYRRFLVSIERDLKVLQFNRRPELRLRWTDPGDSVALFLEGQPWAFIHQEKNHGYSKGVLRPGYGNTWDEELFEQTFGKQ